MNTLFPLIKGEEDDLELHVRLCAERYKELDSRLTSLAGKVDQLGVEIRNNRLEIVKVLIGTGGTILVAMLTLTVTILTKF